MWHVNCPGVQQVYLGIADFTAFIFKPNELELQVSKLFLPHPPSYQSSSSTLEIHQPSPSSSHPGTADSEIHHHISKFSQYLRSPDEQRAKDTVLFRCTKSERKMAKKKSAPTKLGATTAGSAGTPTSATLTTSSLVSDPSLGYKIRVLLYDLQNMAKDRSCEARTSGITDELYLSQPYFTPNEASRIKSAVVDHAIPSFTAEEDVDVEDFEDVEVGIEDFDDFEVEVEDFSEQAKQTTPSSPTTQHTVEETIHLQMATFFEKRRASGDARPCGPHTIAPLYRAVFGISKDELQDDKFLGRLRRCGLSEQRDDGLSLTSDKKKKKKS